MRALALDVVAAAVLAVVLGGACAPPEEGTPCQGTGYRCYDQYGALECRSGTWVYIPCRGTGGCHRDGNQITCDVSLAQIGDNCPSSMEGAGVCSVGGGALYICRSNKFEVASTCRTCTVSGEQIVCQP
jgi:hypothetical protein